MYFKWTKGNSKLAKIKGTIGFGLPAYKSGDGFLVCKNASACISVCYARSGNYLRPQVKAAREHNLEIIRRSISEFLVLAMSDLRNMPGVKVIRWHDSGDVLNNEHLQALYRIARATPNIKHYMYTKRIDLPLYVNKPKNFAVTQSEGGTLDHLIDSTQAHSRIFSTDYQRRKAGYSNGTNTDTLAVAAQPGTRIGLSYHGNANLTKAQRKYFGANWN